MKNRPLQLFLLLILLLVLLIADLMIGSVPLSIESLLAYFTGGEIHPTDELIIHHSRVPKTLTALLCGAALSVAGLQMQTLFRNPLAGPYILGISSGAGLGVALLLMGSAAIGVSAINDWSLAAAAFSGSFAVLLLLFILSLKVRDVMTLLILGIMIGAVATALIGILQFYSSEFQLKSFVIWSLGSLDSISYSKLGIMALLVLLATLLSFFISKGLNSMLLGEQFAKSIGVKVVQLRFLIILSTGILAGTVTAYCGPIGFIGIIVPHMARMLFRTTDHLLLIPISILLGSSVLLFADILSHLLAGELALPINSITALIGIPIVIWILLSKRKISSSF